MTEEINSRDFQDKLLGLTEDYHVKSKEFKEEMKAKYKYFRRLRKKLDHKHATKEEKHRLEVLEIRYGKFMEAFRERKEAEKQAKATIHLMNDMIRHREGEVIAKESTQMELMWKTFLEKYVKQKNPMKGKKKRVDHMLPKVPAHINVQEVDVELFYQEEVREFLKYRIVEREFEQKKKGYVNYIMGIKSKDEEEYELSRTVDELIFAAQSGNYRHVLDLVDYRKKMEFAQNSLVDVNDVGGDGITATFAVVMNVIKHEALDEDANVEDLFLSKWEKRMKKLKWKSKASKLMEMDRIRFDKVIQILLSYGGDLSFPKVEFGKDGMTVFHYAVQTNAMEVVEWLLDHGMDVNHLTTLQHRTALMIAVERNHLELTMFLLKRGAMIAIQHIDNLGNNVLHYAARYASPLLTQLLMLCGVHANVRNKKSMTPAEEAKTFNRMELFTAISSYRSDIKDHVARIECLMAQMLPFDYHTGKFDGFDEDTESAVKPMEDNQEPEQPEGISFVPEETKEENPIVSVRLQRLQQQLDQLNNPKAATSLLPLASSKGRKPMVIPAAATQSTKLSPPVETSPLVISSEQQEGEESSPQDEAVDASTDKKGKDETPSEKRVNKVWNRIQQGFSLKANDSAFDLHPASDPPVAHVHRSKHQTAEEDEEEDDLGPLALPTKHKNDNNIISKPPEHSTMSANLPTIRKKQRGSMIMSAPRIRKTMLQLNFVKNQTK